MTKFVLIMFTAIAVVISLLFIQLLGVQYENGAVLAENYEYHIQILTSNASSYHSSRLREGAYASMEKNGVYAEFVTAAHLDISNLGKFIDMAVSAQVDGVAIQPVDIDETGSLIKAAQDKGLVVTNYESGLNLIPGIPTVGSNYTNTGFLGGEIAVDAVGGDSEAVVILSGSSLDPDTQQQQNLIVKGIADAAAHVENFKISGVEFVNNQLFEAEDVMVELLSRESPPDAIICLDEKSTPAIAQTLVDHSRVGDVQIVGFGSMPQTVDYIRRGVIYGAVCPDSFETGYEIVKQQKNIIEGKEVDEYISLKLYRIDKSNYAQYQET